MNHLGSMARHKTAQHFALTEDQTAPEQALHPGFEQ
jgi:hypothetical protein